MTYVARRREANNLGVALLRKYVTQSEREIGWPEQKTDTVEIHSRAMLITRIEASVRKL
jgi:hypothetical protein